jgi:serine/threonine protein kinase
VNFAKFNTPTAFTPQPARPMSPPLGPPADERPSTPPLSQPPNSQSMRRPPVSNAPAAPPHHEPRGSSGPQALAQPPPMPMPGPPPMPHPQGPPMGGPMGHHPSGMMPYAQPQAQPPPGNRNELSFVGAPLATNMTGAMVPAQSQSLGVRADQVPREQRTNAFHVNRTRAYSFVLDGRGHPIELGSGRFAKVYLGEERWLESKTDFRRPVVIKILQKGVSDDDLMRFQMEKELLERVQGHPNIVELYASGESEDPNFLPPAIRDKCETEFMILERLEMSLEERLKGSRDKASKEELLLCDMRERLFRVLDYMIPIASAVEYAHLVRNICHRDIKPANVLVGLPDPNLRGATLKVRLADFNVAKLNDEEISFGMTRMKAAVPGTLFFQSPEQETNVLELLVNVQQGLPEVEYFEDFYIQIAKNDSFSIYNREQSYPVLYADRARKRLVLARPYREPSETNVRARIQKSVGRPADIYSLGATFYYLISGAYANPKTLYDAFHKFVEYERADENNTIEAYLRHEYGVINSLRAPKTQDGSPDVAPADRFFSYKHYLDGNGELIDPNILLIIAKCMIRNKPDSYCQAHELETKGISDLMTDLINLYSLYGFQPGARPTHLVHRTSTAKRGAKGRVGSSFRRMWLAFLGMFAKKKR